MKYFEKESLGLFPTPMYRLPNISRELGTNIWIKRDDLCGVALGGNKVRKLEYLLHDAKQKGFDAFATTLTVSPLKDAQMLNSIGNAMGQKAGVRYLESDFKKKNGYLKSIELSKQFNLYRQNYCGCEYSKRTNP